MNIFDSGYQLGLSPDDPTVEEITKVRRLECRMHGHRWDVVEALGVGPVMVVCLNHCGESREIVQPTGGAK